MYLDYNMDLVEVKHKIGVNLRKRNPIATFE